MCFVCIVVSVFADHAYFKCIYCQRELYGCVVVVAMDAEAVLNRKDLWLCPFSERCKGSWSAERGPFAHPPLLSLTTNTLVGGWLLTSDKSRFL